MTKRFRPSSLVLPVAGGAAVGVLIGRLFPAVSLVGVVGWLLLGVILLWCTLILHELGHWIAGRLAGFRAVMFSAGPLLITREPDRLRVSPGSLAAFGAFVALVPVGTEHLARRTMVMIAGGPAASLIGTGLGSAAWAGFSSSRAAVFALVFALMSLVTAVFTLWPSTAAGAPSDGLRLGRLWRADPDGARELALIALAGESFAGIRPREWSEVWIRRAIEDTEDVHVRTAGRLVAYHHALDSGDVEAARAVLGALLLELPAVPSTERSRVLLDAACFLAYHDRDPDRARAFLSQATGGPMVSAHQRPLANAALALAEGRAGDAMALAEHARAALARVPDRGEARAAADMVDAVMREARGAVPD
jgi:hypothetical protein